jgi:hypothetical protein
LVVASLLSSLLQLTAARATAAIKNTSILVASELFE